LKRIEVEKESLRRQLLEKLLSLSNDQVVSLSFMVTKQLVNFLNIYPELKGQIGSAYLPLKAEVAPVYQQLLHEIPVDLAFPVLVEGVMKFGIPQGIPRGGTWMDPPYFEVTPQWVLVPGVGFDLSGARLGRGKGYYDRYLEVRSAVRIGLAWSEQIVENVPMESHDCHMDFIITENFCWDVSHQKRF
jgi:5-formyltetrahydrofolate cyclo-ligase